MIKFTTNKEKTLTFDIVVEGIDPSLLNYTLRLTENGIDYGFKGKMVNNEVIVHIPPLNTIINNDRIGDLRKIKLEIHDANNKYYMKPFEDDVIIEKEPTLDISIKENEDTITESIKVNVKDDSDVIVEKKIKKEVKKTKLSSFLTK